MSATGGGRARRSRRLPTPTAAAGGALFAALVVLALAAPIVAPRDPAAQGPGPESRFLSPSADHPFGTDRLGRDLFSRTVHGARVSLGVGVGAAFVATAIGTLVGAAAGYFRGPADALAMRAADAFLAFPRLVLLIAAVAAFRPTTPLLVVVLGATGWMGTARLVRARVLSLRGEPFIEAVRALGVPHHAILAKHVIPNALGPALVAGTLAVGNAILLESSLSFLGFGVPPPAPSWGNLIAGGRDVLLSAWWVTAFPGIALVATVLSVNLIGDGLRAALDPRGREG
jgi:peptide/nickel transport system permease protein